MADIPVLPVTLTTVILSGAERSRSDRSAESKDPVSAAISTGLKARSLYVPVAPNPAFGLGWIPQLTPASR